jgi:hypothetical protein
MSLMKGLVANAFFSLSLAFRNTDQNQSNLLIHRKNKKKKKGKECKKCANSIPEHQIRITLSTRFQPKFSFPLTHFN